jgi:hypothetical protein
MLSTQLNTSDITLEYEARSPRDLRITRTDPGLVPQYTKWVCCCDRQVDASSWRSPAEYGSLLVMRG